MRRASGLYLPRTLPQPAAVSRAWPAGAVGLGLAHVLLVSLAVLDRVQIGAQAAGEWGGALQVRRLTRPAYCAGQVLASERLYRTMTARSRLQCLGHCRPDSSCMAIVYESRTGRCHLGDSKAYENCSNMAPAAPDMSFYQEPPPPPPCGDNQVRDQKGLCVCTPGFWGDPCIKYFHDCSDIKQQGLWVGDSVYSVMPDGAPKPFAVYCRQISSVRTYILDRRRKSVDFFRTYQEYVDGFGDLNDDYWVGLRNVWALTAGRGYELRVNIKVLNDSQNFLQAYSEFRVTDEASGFRLRFNRSSITNGPGDCLLPLYDAPFSTYDYDVDEAMDVNCGLLRKGGLWYRGANCSTCNPFGVLYQPDTGQRLGREDEACWDNVLGNTALFKISLYLLPAPEL